MRRDRIIVWGWCALLTATLTATALWFAQHRSVWSPDSGALLAMAKSWAAGGSAAYPTYSLQAFDPDWLLHPLTGQGYVATASQGHTLVYSPVLPIVAGTAYRIFGFFGLALPSVLAGVLASLAALLTAREMGVRAWWLGGVLGIATPVAVYGSVFWHHAPTICAAAWAFYFLVRTYVQEDARSAIWAGLLLGVALFFHELAMALAIAATISLVPRWRLVGRFAGGFAAGTAVWVGVNLALYGKPFGPHVSGANNVLGSPVYRPGLLDASAMLDRASVQLFGFPATDYAVWLMAACLVAAFLSVRIGKSSESRQWALALVGLMALFAITTWPRQTLNNGLFQTTPLLALAWATPTEGKPERAFGLRLCGVFILLVVLNPIPPLMGWGSRFLMTVASPLLCLGLCSLEDLGWRWLCTVLIAVGIVSQALGIRSVDQDLSYSRKLCDAVQGFDAPVVSEMTWLGPECQAADLSEPLFIIGDTIYTPVDLDAVRAKFGQYLDQFRPPEVVEFGREDSRSTLHRLIRSHGYSASRQGVAAGLPFTRYVLTRV